MINARAHSSPERLDLNGVTAKAAVDAGCRLVINTDAHYVDHLSHIRLCIAMARRGWLTKKDVANTLSLKKLRKILKPI
ncbi:MAG: hypothetical protein P8Y18_08065 [Candidatus Bathyarchaeota archaeon]